MKQNYTCEAVNDHIYRIKDAFGVAMYLVIGKERAALLDTGHGFTGLRALVESLTPLPVTVLLTHGHIDHALGVFEFDEVYMNPLDEETFSIHSDQTFRADFFSSRGVCMKKLDLQPVRPVRFLPIVDGQVFDLGGLHLKAYHTPGHTKGMTMFLFVEDRMMLFGDGCGPNTMIMEDCSGSLREYYGSLQTVKAHESEYDRVLRNHGACESPKELLDNVMALCTRILDGTDAKCPLPDFMQRMFVSRLDPVPPSYSARPIEVSGNDVVFTDDLPEGNINYRADKVG